MMIPLLSAFGRYRHGLVLGLLGILLFSGIVVTSSQEAWAGGKKKKSKTDIEVEKVLTPISQELSPLYQKAQARGLFSPADIAKANDLKLQLMDLINEYPSSKLLAKPAYEAGRLFKSREMYDDAYDFFNYIQTNFANTPYASQARVEIQRMKQTLGDSYFADSAGAGPSAAVSAP